MHTYRALSFVKCFRTRKKGNTPLQYLLLLHVQGFSGRSWATVGELAERLYAQHHGVVGLISRCEKLGWVERKQGQTDRREVEVNLTARGGRMAAKMAQLHRDEHLNPAGSLLLPELRGSTKMVDSLRVADAVRVACVQAALDGYERAQIAGLCREGAWECAVDAMRMLDITVFLDQA